MEKRIAYFTNIAPHYRDPLWRVLVSTTDFEIHFFFGEPRKNGIRSIDFNNLFWLDYKNRIHILRNRRIKGLLIWQKDVIREILSNRWESFMFLGDMYIISTWIAVVLAKIRNKKVYYWTHGIYGNENRLKLFIRRQFLMLADKLLLYGNHSKSLMIKNGFDEEKLHVVFNTLDYYRHFQLRNEVINSDFYRTRNYFKNYKLPILIFIGRLTENKKLDLLVKAVVELNAEKNRLNLILVGDGPVKSSLENLTTELNGTFKFYGESYDEQELGRLISNASVCVSPGNIGLTAIHALSFGTPVITHNNFNNQMPEFEAIDNGINGAFFEENDLGSLKKTIADWLNRHPQKDIGLRNSCYKKIDSFYNPGYQLQIFRKILL